MLKKYDNSVESYFEKCRVADEQAISVLKKELKTYAKNKKNPDRETVILVVKDMLSNVPLAKTAKKLKNISDPEGFILDIVATFGTWLTHSEGKVTTEYIFSKDAKTQSPKEGLVIIPLGYEPQAQHGRDLVKAITAILSLKPSDDIIVRFVSRTYNSRTDLLNYPLVAGVWKFSTMDRLSTIKNVNADEVFYTQVIASYDLLNRNIKASNDIVNGIILGSLNGKKLLNSLSKVLWLNESDLTKLYKTLENIHNSGDKNKFEQSRLTLVSTLSLNYSKYRIISIRQLSAGQVRRICEIEGLIADESEKIDELEIRNNLKSLGLIRDADVLVPEAIRAYQKGLSAEFWAVMNARADGDLSWPVMLQELSE